MNKTLSIFRHEFRKTIKKVGFIILTLSLPVLALLGIAVYQIVSGIAAPPAEANKVGYVDQIGDIDQFTSQGNVTLLHFDDVDGALQALINKEITYYFVIPNDLTSGGVIKLYTMQKELTPPVATTTAIKNFISSNLLDGKVTVDVITWVESPLSLVSTTLTSTGEVAPKQAGYVNFIVPGIFSFLMALSLIFSSTYVLQSLSEEKENRVMEILLSSVSTRQLLTGKVLGLGVAGLTQVAVWVMSFPLLLNLASSSVGGIISTIKVPFSFWILGILYFILGYALFAVLSACISAVTSTVQEAQGLAAIYTIFNFVPFWFVSLLLIFPNSPIWVILSIFPFTAPVVILLRLGLFGVPAWQLAVSIIVLILCITGGLLMAGKLLRAYTLMYGRRPDLKEIVRSLKAG
jgi:ABC-2 type transport system permease protein